MIWFNNLDFSVLTNQQKLNILEKLFPKVSLLPSFYIWTCSEVILPFLKWTRSICEPLIHYVPEKRKGTIDVINGKKLLGILI